MYNARARRPVSCVNVLCENRSALESVRCGVLLCIMEQLWNRGHTTAGRCAHCQPFFCTSDVASLRQGLHKKERASLKGN